MRKRILVLLGLTVVLGAPVVVTNSTGIDSTTPAAGQFGAANDLDANGSLKTNTVACGVEADSSVACTANIPPFASDTTAIVDLTTNCDLKGQGHIQNNVTPKMLALCSNPATESYAIIPELRTNQNGRGIAAWGVSDGDGTCGSTVADDTCGQEVCLSWGLACVDVISFATVGTPTDSDCTTPQTAGVRFIAQCK